jgi:hypothetical protein
MTEAEWLSVKYEHEDMISFLKGRASDCKFRLFAAACCRRYWRYLAEESCRRAVEIAEMFADNEVSRDELVKADYAADAVESRWAYSVSSACLEDASAAAESVAEEIPHAAGWESGDYHQKAFPIAQEDADTGQCELLREIFGPLPFRKVQLDPAWMSKPIQALAQAAYEEWLLPQAHLDPSRLAVLADALEEAGCTNEEILAHLREQGRVHVRGCWVIDLILGRQWEAQ